MVMAKTSGNRQKASNKPTAPSGKTKKRLSHILLIDDEKNLLNTIEFILEAANYRVTKALDGQEAIKILMEKFKKNDLIDLIITDIRMPNLDGIDFLQYLKNHQLNLPVIVISNHGSYSLKNRLSQMGYQHFLDKPVSDEQLLQAIAAVLPK
jgi:two-component system response regulator GlrR